ncbi:Mur ligase [Amylocystis lapponica]|nr:Mur ligase [Amylocystis lapponica]
MSIDLSLDRIRVLQALLPPYTRPTCHIAGTNGKGSVSALLSSILSASTLSVGRFNSPHLLSVRDSIALNHRPVAPDVYAAARADVEHADRTHAVGASNFELLTCTALLIFERASVDVAVLEAGMGGRLDATNIIPDACVLASALTAVDLDHQAFLGNTIAAIAREKAAIARPRRPFVLGQQTHAEIEGVVRDVVQDAGGDVQLAPVVTMRAWDESVDGPLSFSAESFAPPPPQPVDARLLCFPEPIRALLPLYGEHQLANLGVALGVVSALLTHPSSPSGLGLRLHERITPESVSRGIQSTTWPGRLSFHTLALPASPARESPLHNIHVLADGAHNPASARTLSAYLAALPRRPRTLTFLLALSHSPPKTPLQTLAPLFAELPASAVGAALLRFSPPAEMPWVRAESHAELRGAVSALSPGIAIWPEDGDSAEAEDAPVQERLRAALEWAVRRGDGDGLVVVAGSLYLVADFYRFLESIGGWRAAG